MPGAKLRIGPTHALRLILEREGTLDVGSILRLMNREGVGVERAGRALHRAVRHGQVIEEAGSYRLARKVGTW